MNHSTENFIDLHFKIRTLNNFEIFRAFYAFLEFMKIQFGNEMKALHSILSNSKCKG